MDAAFVNFICKGRILLYFREIWLLFNKKVLGINVKDGRVVSVRCSGGELECDAVILATGTYLDSTIIIGESILSSGPDGMHPSIGLADQLRQIMEKWDV